MRLLLAFGLFVSACVAASGCMVIRGVTAAGDDPNAVFVFAGTDFQGRVYRCSGSGPDAYRCWEVVGPRDLSAAIEGAPQIEDDEDDYVAPARRSDRDDDEQLERRSRREEILRRGSSSQEEVPDAAPASGDADGTDTGQDPARAALIADLTAQLDAASITDPDVRNRMIDSALERAGFEGLPAAGDESK